MLPLSRYLVRRKLADLQEALKRLPVVDETIQYAVLLLERQDQVQTVVIQKLNEYLNWGAGPRASQNLILAAKAKSIMDGQGSPTISHVKAVAKANITSQNCELIIRPRLKGYLLMI